MKKNSLLFLLLIISALSSPTAARENKDVTVKSEGLYIKSATVSQLSDIYKKYGYNAYLPLPDYKVPPIFLAELPNDFKTISDEKTRNELFIKIISPQALKINQEILAEREKIETIDRQFREKQELSPQEQEFIEKAAVKYDIFSRFKGHRRYQTLLRQLLLKVDTIPPSFYIAMAAIATEWGTSRAALQGNNLYKELVWNTDEGLEPEGEEAEKDYRLRLFNSLEDSMRSFALDINSNINYRDFRSAREVARYRDNPYLGRSMAHNMLFYSPLPNYIGLLEYTITFYQLNVIDKSSLDNLRLQKTSGLSNCHKTVISLLTNVALL